MSKKRGKSPGAGTAVVDNKWDINITNEELNTNAWNYSLAVLIPNIPEDRETIDYINVGINGGLRRKFTAITMEKLMQLVGEFGNPKNKKGKQDQPLNSEVCEAAQSQYDKEGSISPLIMAKLIKWAVMTQKHSDLNVTSPKKSDPKTAKPDAKKGDKGDKADRSKSQAGKKAAAKTPEPPSVKKDSKLRKRGEPDPDIPYIDDEPDDGSSRYFILSGVNDAHILECMAELGCVSSCIVKVTRDIHIPKEADLINSTTDIPSTSEQQAKQQPVADGPIDEENKEQCEDEYKLKLDSVNQLWSNVKEVLNRTKQLLDTPIISMQAKHLMFPVNLEDEELKLKCSMDLFECTAVLMYDLLDLKRQWLNYLNKSKLIQLPEKQSTVTATTAVIDAPKEEPTQSPTDDLGKSKEANSTTFTEVDLNYYYYSLRDLPIEETSIYLQVNAMLDQVEVSLGEKNVEYIKQEENKPKDIPDSLAEMLKQMTDNIYLTKETKAKVLNEMGLSDLNTKQKYNQDFIGGNNTAIHSLDGISVRAQKLNNSDCLTSELRVLINSFRHMDLTTFHKLDDDLARQRAARVMQLVGYLDNSALSRLEIDYVIKIFLLETMQFTGTDDNGIMIEPSEEGVLKQFHNHPWDDPFMIMDDVAKSIVDQEWEQLRLKTKKAKSSIHSSDESGDEINLPKSNRSEISTESGILKSSRTSSRNSSRVQSPSERSRKKSSVHFNKELMKDDTNESDPMDIYLTEDQLTIDDLLDSDKALHLQNLLATLLHGLRKRSFTEWCFEELYEPHVLLQLFQEAFYRLPHVDVYPLRYDLNNRKLVILDNPYRNQSQRYNHQIWSQWLHSNVGFRNYLDHVSEKITDWNRDQEAIYQAQLLSKEVQMSKSEDEKSESEAEQTKATNKKGGKPADKNKKRTPSKSRSRSASRSSNEESKPKSDHNLILPNSLKAQKLEKERLEKLRDDEERKKEEKRVASAKKKAEKESAKAKDNKRPSSKGSNKSKGKKKSVAEPAAVETEEKEKITADNNQDIDQYWPFISYDLGDKLAHYNGELTHLFANDGSIIRIHTHKRTLNTKLVRLSLITTSNHVFSIHVIDPMAADSTNCDEDAIAASELLMLTGQNGLERCEWSKFNCATCVFNDGLCIVSSNNGYSGIWNDGDNTGSGDQVGEQSQRAKSGRSRDANSETQRSSDSKNKEEHAEHDREQSGIDRYSTQMTGVQSEPTNVTQRRNNIDRRGLPNLVVTIPNGIMVKVGYEITDDLNPQVSVLLHMIKPEAIPTPHVKQHIHTSTRLKQAVTEKSRYVTNSGSIICLMSDSLVRVLFPDGTCATTTLSTDKEQCEPNPDDTKAEPEPEVLNVKDTSNKKKPKQSKANIELQADQPSDEAKKPISSMKAVRNWEIILPNGELYQVKTNMSNLHELLQKKINEEINEENLLDNSVVVQSDNNQEMKPSMEEDESVKQPLCYVENMSYKESLMISSATDQSSGEMLLTRSDKTCLLVSPEAGIYLSEHPDGTRFTKYYFVEKSGPRRSYPNDSDYMETKIIELLQIESKDYPKLTVNLTNGTIETRFGSMGSLISSNTGEHIFRHSDSSEIEYRPDGEIIITAPSPPPPQMTFLQPYGGCSYLFNPSGDQDKMIFELIDSDSTHMLVDIFGNYKITPPTRKMKKSEEPAENTDENEQLNKPNSAISGASAFDNENQSGLLRKYDQHSPRIFIVNQDGSGSELLRYRDIVDFLMTSEINDSYHQTKEEIQDCPQIHALTIFHPIDKNQRWTYNYTNASIMPKGLTCRDLKSLSPDVRQNILASQKSGQEIDKLIENDEITNKNKQLDCGWKNPLLFRQFYHYPVITEEIRSKLAQHLIEYNRKILEQRKFYKEIEIVDDRNSEEIQRSIDVQQRYLSRKMAKEVLENAMKQISESELPQQKNKAEIINSVEDNKENHEKRLESIMERSRISKEKFEKNREALRHNYVPNYFTSIYGKDFISTQALDLQSLNQAMKIFPSTRQNTAHRDEEEVQSSTENSENVKESPTKSNDVTYDGNITEFDERKYHDFFPQKTIFKKLEKKYIYYDSTLVLPEIQRVLPQSRDLGLPKCLFSERPSECANIRQATIEDPVRRKCLTTSIVGGPRLGQIFQRHTRGLNCLPARIDTGLLCEGQRYTYKFKLINTGPESCRFKIKQPPATSGIWVEFQPGPIPAGLSRTIFVHIYAISTNPECAVKSLEYNLPVTTETDILYIPIVARVMLANNYRQSQLPSKSTTVLPTAPQGLYPDATAGGTVNPTSTADYNKLRRQTITLGRV